MAFLTLAELRGLAGIPDTGDDEQLQIALDAAEGAVRAWCARDFTAGATTATARVFDGDGTYLLDAPDLDFNSTTDLVVEVDDNDSGTYGTTLTLTTHFVVMPHNARLYGQAWAYDQLRRVDGYGWPTGYRPCVRVTARWGWPAVPAQVKQATALVAQELYKRKDAPFGIAGFGDFGPVRLSADALRSVSALLEPYRRPGIA